VLWLFLFASDVPLAQAANIFLGETPSKKERKE
jgi:hypothetical protein